ncbi:MAG: Ig-like domain-containing protein [Acidobacteriota bacterium]|nr:Ig-like domain-containing protein [Acidobacteriota bacterium]
MTINATASDTDGTVAKVEFFQGVTKLGEDATAPYSFTSGNVAAGTYSWTAKATTRAFCHWRADFQQRRCSDRSAA